MRVAVLVLASSGCIPHLYTKGGGAPSDWVPPTNSWDISEPPADLVGEGCSIGDTIPDYRLMDQHGDEVSLWQFYGSVVLVDVSTGWCAPCQALAQTTQDTWERYRDQGFVYLTVLQEDIEARPPDREFLNFWADSFGIDAPVVADGDYTVECSAGAYPALVVVDRRMRVKERVEQPIAEEVDAAIERAL